MPSKGEALYEITGGKAPYTMRAVNDGVACVAVIMLGYGTLGFRHLRKRGVTMPVFSIPESFKLWVRDTFGMSVPELELKIAQGFVGELKETLDSVTLGLPGERNMPRPRERWDLEAIAQSRGKEVINAVQKSLKRHGNTRH